MPLTRRHLIATLATLGAAAASLPLARRLGQGTAAGPPADRSGAAGLRWPAARALPEFRMTSADGRAIDASWFEDHWSLLYFGYLQCPDVCPTTLQAMAGLRRAMQAAGMPEELYRFVFITVDPDHDSLPQMQAYSAFFDPQIQCLRGEPEELRRLAEAAGVIYLENIAANGSRSMDHSTSIILADPQARFVASLPAPHEPALMLAQIRALTLPTAPA
jgi:protein SCO1/2